MKPLKIKQPDPKLLEMFETLAWVRDQVDQVCGLPDHMLRAPQNSVLKLPFEMKYNLVYEKATME